MFGSILSLLVMLVPWVLKKLGASEKVFEAFQGFVQAAQAETLVSVKLKESYDGQLERIKDDLWKKKLAEDAKKAQAPGAGGGL